MSSHTAPIVEELARDYGNYLKLDLSSQVCVQFYITFMNSARIFVSNWNVQICWSDKTRIQINNSISDEKLSCYNRRCNDAFGRIPVNY